MRTVSILILSLIFIIVIALSSCDKSGNKVTDNDPDANLLCGDANGDGAVNIHDAKAMINFSLADGPEIDSISSETDNIKGITINDPLRLMAYFYRGGNPPICSSNLPDTMLPLSTDTIFVSDRTIPPGVENWEVQISIKPSSVYQGITFPFHYDCPDSSIICDSIVYHISKLYSGTSKPIYPNLILDNSKIDTLNQTGLICRGNSLYGLTPDIISLASIWFSLTPSADSQMITFDTTTYPPSNYLIMSRFEYPETIASIPVIIFQE